jgi:hypothetical protein
MTHDQIILGYNNGPTPWIKHRVHAGQPWVRHGGHKIWSSWVQHRVHDQVSLGYNIGPMIRSP